MTAAEAEAAGGAEAWGGRGPAASYAEWLAEGQKELEAVEWDSADSNAYQARVEAGLEPEAEAEVLAERAQKWIEEQRELDVCTELDLELGL